MWPAIALGSSENSFQTRTINSHTSLRKPTENYKEIVASTRNTSASTDNRINNKATF